MRTVILATLLFLSSSLAGCISEKEDNSDEPEFFGQVYWGQDGLGVIFEEDTGYTVLPLILDSCEEMSEALERESEERGEFCAFEWYGLDVETIYNGEYYETCQNSEGDVELCYDIHLIEGGIISTLTFHSNRYAGACEIYLDKIDVPNTEYYNDEFWLSEEAFDWHSEFASSARDSEDGVALELGCDSVIYEPTYLIESNEGDSCGMYWPDDPFKAAIYSFIAEYHLGYGAAVGCYFGEYPDLSDADVADELEQNWDTNNALEYAQNWVDENALDYEIERFNLTSEFNISEGGLGWVNSSHNNQTTDCGDSEEVIDTEENTSSFFNIEANPNPESPGMKCFTKYVDVFGLGVYAESGLSDAQVLHAAAVFAELLDNDEDGIIDDQILFSRLENMSAMVPMFNSENPDQSPALEDFFSNYNGNGVSAVLFAEEVDPDRPMVWGSDATIEEIMHTINHVGHVYVYPDAFGLQPSSSLLSDAMDAARGGQFIEHPGDYPEDAWYHYDDTTCDYGCMAIEYIYWAQVSNMDILNDTETCNEIANEWEPCSKELLESMDVLIYELVTDPQYHLPQDAPDGVYNPQTAEE